MAESDLEDKIAAFKQHPNDNFYKTALETALFYVCKKGQTEEAFQKLQEAFPNEDLDELKTNIENKIAKQDKISQMTKEGINEEYLEKATNHYRNASNPQYGLTKDKIDKEL